MPRNEERPSVDGKTRKRESTAAQCFDDDSTVVARARFLGNVRNTRIHSTSTPFKRRLSGRRGRTRGSEKGFQ